MLDPRTEMTSAPQRRCWGVHAHPTAATFHPTEKRLALHFRRRRKLLLQHSPRQTPFTTRPAPNCRPAQITAPAPAPNMPNAFQLVLSRKRASLMLSWDGHLLPTKGRGMAGARHRWLGPTGLRTEARGHGAPPELPKHPLQSQPWTPALPTSAPFALFKVFHTHTSYSLRLIPHISEHGYLPVSI